MVPEVPMSSASKLRGKRVRHRRLFQKERFFIRPRLEVLEDRRLPSAVNTWVAPGSSGNWNTEANWSLNHVPTSTEVATFDGSSAAVCTIDAPAMGTNAVSGINITSSYLGP